MSEILKYKPFVGLQIKCNSCGRLLHKKIPKVEGCKHPLNKQIYKAVLTVPNSGGKRTTRNLISRNYEDAIAELLAFRSEVSGKKPEAFFETKSKPKILIYTIALYLDFLSDVNVPEHKKKHNSKTHIAQQSSMFKLFIKFLKSKFIEIKNFEITQIDEFIVGDYYKFLSKYSKSNYTFNHAMKSMRALFDFLINKKFITSNPFKDVNLKSEKSTNITVSPQDFYELLQVINPQNAIDLVGKTKRNMFKPWLRDIFKLKAYTGRRNEEVALMKWNWIFSDGQNPIYMKCPNIKVNKQKNNEQELDKEYNYIPIAKELKEVLFNLGFEEKIDSDEFIIAPKSTNRKTIEDQTSKAFSFFFKKLNRSYNLEYNYLRKTYITQLEIFGMQNISLVNEHGNKMITNKHYINEIDIAKFIAKSNFRVFPEEESSNNAPTTAPNEKAPRVEAPERLDFQCGEYRNRTDDLLTASQTL